MRRLAGPLSALIVLAAAFFPGEESLAGIAQSFEVASSPNPVGSGARALGMGGAFIGVADDATAASWNPAGLVQLETPEISVVGALHQRREETENPFYPEVSGPESITKGDLNHLSIAYPFVLFSRNITISLNYQHLYDFTEKGSFRVSVTGPPESREEWWSYEHDGGLWTLAPAFAVRLFPTLSLGATLNFWGNGLFDNTWKQRRSQRTTGSFLGNPFDSQRDIEETFLLTGFNFNLGVLWQPNGALSLGAVVKSPFSADLTREFSSHYTLSRTGQPPQSTTDRFTEEETLDMPLSYGVGLALRFGDTTTLALDVFRTEWGAYVIEGEDGREISPLTGREEAASDIDTTTQVRIGGEYLIIGEKTVAPLRAGLFYDPEPASGQPLDFWGLSLGTGIAYGRIVFDLAYQYRFARDIETQAVSDQRSEQDAEQHTVYMSLIYHF